MGYDYPAPPPIPQEEERALLALAQQGDNEARNRLLEANLRFCVLCVGKYKGRLPFHDACQEACFSLIKAIEHYNLSKETCRLISYAESIIRHDLEIKKLDLLYPVRIPRSAAYARRKRLQGKPKRGQHNAKTDKYVSAALRQHANDFGLLRRPTPSVLDELIKAEEAQHDTALLAWFRQTWIELPSPYREIIDDQLHKVSISETANRLGYHYDAVRKLRQKAKQMLLELHSSNCNGAV